VVLPLSARKQLPHTKVSVPGHGPLHLPQANPPANVDGAVALAVIGPIDEHATVHPTLDMSAVLDEAEEQVRGCDSS